MKKENLGIVFIVCTPMIIGALIGIVIYTDNQITPMDVYQGKTTLEYKVVDGAKVDSCVIFKK